MPVKPLPYKAVCKKCGRTKIVASESDCLLPTDFPFCSKCKIFMTRSQEPLNVFDIALYKIKKHIF